MKAKVKETGEIIEVIAYSMDDNIITQYLSKDGYIIYESNELEIIFDQTHNNSKNILSNPINWEQRRWEASVAAMQGMIVNAGRNGFNFDRHDLLCKKAISIAKELIKQYKEE